MNLALTRSPLPLTTRICLLRMPGSGLSDPKGPGRIIDGVEDSAGSGHFNLPLLAGDSANWHCRQGDFQLMLA